MHANRLFYPLYYDVISLRSLKITQAFHLLLSYAENQIVIWDFKIQNSVRITEGSDNGDSDNRGPTVHRYVIAFHTYIAARFNALIAIIYMYQYSILYYLKLL